MVWWILGGIALFLFLICMTRLGLFVTFGGEKTVLDLKIGPFKVRLSPTETGQSAQKTHKKTKKKPPKTPAYTPPQYTKPTFADIKEAIARLTPPCKKAFHRTRRGIRIHPLRVAMTIGGAEDAALAAEMYGYAHAAVWTAMPVLEQLLVIPNPQIHIGLDFVAEKTHCAGEVAVSIPIGTLIGVGISMSIPALQWFLSYRKQHKQQPPAPEPAKQAAA